MPMPMRFENTSMKSVSAVVGGIAIVFVAIFFGSAFLKKTSQNAADTALSEAVIDTFTHPIYPFDAKGFSEGVDEAASDKDESFPFPVKGGIIPHHTLPSFLIAGFFQRLSGQHPKRIVLIGPNHPDKGQSKLLTSRASWQTPFGTVVTDVASVDALVRDDHASIDDERLSQEHSVAAIMPYIKYYLPDATVVPIILKSSVTLDESEVLSRDLADMLGDDDTVLIASVDFSHYLTSREAQENDTKTRRLIDAFDSRSLFGMTSDYLDSPPSIATLLETMKRAGAKKTDLLANTNSGLLAHDALSGVTSYFVFAFYKEN